MIGIIRRYCSRFGDVDHPRAILKIVLSSNGGSHQMPATTVSCGVRASIHDCSATARQSASRGEQDEWRQREAGDGRRDGLLNPLCSETARRRGGAGERVGTDPAPPRPRRSPSPTATDTAAARRVAPDQCLRRFCDVKSEL